jgi:hypothetical protein
MRQQAKFLVVAAGGLFNYARKSGMIPAQK